MANDVKSFTAFETWQKVLDDLSKGLNLDPDSTREYFLSNIVQRVYALMYGKEPISGKLVLLRTTTDGRLQVSAASNIFTINETFSVSLAVSASQTINFSQTVTRVDFWSYDNVFNIVRTVSGLPNQQSFSFPAGGFYSIDASTDGLILSNPSSTSTVSGQVIGWS